jgi:SH3-like domain-containing protein
VLAAKVHGEASVSSPTLRFYQPGTTLQVVSRQNGWVQITDPTSGERGWVFEQYLVPADSPTTTQTAIATTARKAAAEPAEANPPPTAKKRGRTASRAARTDKSAVTQFDRRWERRAARRGGLFFFGRFARAE